MWVLFGSYGTEEPQGHVADYCPVCRGVTLHAIIDHVKVSHLYFIPLSHRPQGTARRCAKCGNELTYFPGDYTAVLDAATAMRMPLDEVVRITNPRLAEGRARAGDDPFARTAAPADPLRRAELTKPRPKPPPHERELLRPVVRFADLVGRTYPAHQGCGWGCLSCVLLGVAFVPAWLAGVSGCWFALVLPVALLVGGLVYYLADQWGIKRWCRVVLIPRARRQGVPLRDFLFVLYNSSWVDGQFDSARQEMIGDADEIRTALAQLGEDVPVGYSPRGARDEPDAAGSSPAAPAAPDGDSPQPLVAELVEEPPAPRLEGSREAPTAPRPTTPRRPAQAEAQRDAADVGPERLRRVLSALSRLPQEDEVRKTRNRLRDWDRLDDGQRRPLLESAEQLAVRAARTQQWNLFEASRASGPRRPGCLTALLFVAAVCSTYLWWPAARTLPWAALIAPAALVGGLLLFVFVQSYARHRWVHVGLPREARRRGVDFARLALVWQRPDVAFAELEAAPPLSDAQQVQLLKDMMQSAEELLDAPKSSQL